MQELQYTIASFLININILQHMHIGNKIVNCTLEQTNNQKAEYMYSCRKYPYPSHGMSGIGNSKGIGASKARIFKGKYGA